MALYVDEEEVWKCPKHPSKRRKSGICPTCLRDRLVTLCPDCANARPCECCAASSSSSSSSSFSLFTSRRGGGGYNAESAVGVGSVGRVSNLIDCEPSFRRSRSVTIPFFRSRFGSVRESVGAKPPPPPPGNRSKSLFWSVFKKSKSKKGESERDEELKGNNVVVEEDYERVTMMRRSRSVSVQVTSNSGAGGVRLSSPTKGRGWHFPSPIKAFRQSKTAKVIRERSPLYRG